MLKYIIAVLSFILLFSCSAEKTSTNWKGYAIIGNGEVCAVYSDDDRLDNSGIQHFYFQDYTVDYISSSSCNIPTKINSIVKGKKSVEMANFYTTSTKTYFDNGELDVQVKSLPNRGINIALISDEALKNSIFEYQINFNAKIQTDKIVNLSSKNVNKTSAVLTWNNGVNIIVLPQSSFATINIVDSILTVQGTLNRDTVRINLIATKDNPEKAIEKFTHAKVEEEYWQHWIRKGIYPKSNNIQYLEFFKRNLYATKSANLQGNVPADITGQFVTNNMPQLYPRDAMMIARVFIKTGHLTEAKNIIEFWADQNIPRKSKGEWYARYDAHGNAVDAGSGARYDEPEWDANGYFIELVNMYFKETGIWLVDSLQIYEIADFLVNKIDQNGLLFEGGIIEWSGYLPATNMTAAAALQTASKIAKQLGNNKKSEIYKQSSKTLSNNLQLMFDKNRDTYADLRFTGTKSENNSSIQIIAGDSLYLWDTSANFGILWGFPDHIEMQKTNIFYKKNTVKLGGGVQYFEAPDPGLAAYGNDVFIFTTAARSQYLSLTGNLKESKAHIDWMILNSNIYGLMPERIYLNNSNCSDASPLSWCCAEFAAASLEYSQHN